MTDSRDRDDHNFEALQSAPREAFSIRAFVHDEAFGGILLLACAIVALGWANSPWKESYFDLWNAEVTLGTIQLHLTETLGHWVNDGLMAIFFFVVGLEIKREVLVGELASPRRAALPAVAALGGALIPAAMYLAINAGHEGSEGWGVPMATDIAFALGILALLGDRVPLGLKVFLTALAIVDDLLAVVVIAIFYSGDIAWGSFGAAAAILAVLAVANRRNIRHPAVYAVLGTGLWIAIFDSGIHATVAGVLLAFTIPSRMRMDPVAFVARGRRLLDVFDHAGPDQESILINSERQEALAELEDALEGVGAPLHRMEHALHPWVAFAIVPLFALANAGVTIGGDLGETMGNRVTFGVLLGLVAGKLIGITLAAWISVRAGVTTLPESVTWRHLHGAAVLAGIGFTMSLFVADLAFAGGEEAHLLTSAKLGIVGASIFAGLAGWLVLRGASGEPRRPVVEM